MKTSKTAKKSKLVDDDEKLDHASQPSAKNLKPPAEKPRKQPPSTKSDDEDSSVSSQSQSDKSGSGASTPSSKSNAASASSPQLQPRKEPDATFGQLYLRLLTSELASDLDAVRKAADFRDDSSLPLLVRALRQGEGCFGVEEKARVEAAAAASLASGEKIEE